MIFPHVPRICVRRMRGWCASRATCGLTRRWFLRWSRLVSGLESGVNCGSAGGEKGWIDRRAVSWGVCWCPRAWGCGGRREGGVRRLVSGLLAWTSSRLS